MTRSRHESAVTGIDRAGPWFARRCRAAAASALLLGLAGGCGSGSGAAVEHAPVARVERARLERVVVATGTVEPETEVEVRPRVSGIVQKLHVKAGDRVVAGEALVEIDRELLDAQLREARAQLEGARVELKHATTFYGRAATLRRDGTMAIQEHDQAKLRLEAAGAAVTRAEAAVESLDIQRRYTTVTAPMAGTILDVDVKEGSAVASVLSVTGGTRLLTLAADDVLFLKGLVDENEIAHVAVGQPARIRTEAFPGRTFEGRVQEIKPLGERQQNVTYFEVKVRVTDADGQALRARMSGDADIVTEIVEDALVVPETALVYEGDQILVEQPGAGEAVVRRPVRVGIVDGNRVQVLDGLAAGEEVRLK